MSNLNLIDIKLRGTDSGVLALLYDTSLLVLLSTVDGSVVGEFTQPLMQCTLGCTLVYPSTTLTLIGVYVSSGQEYLGLQSFTDSSSPPPSTAYLLQYSGYNFRYPVADYTDDNRIVIGATSTSQTLSSMTMGLSFPFSTYDFVIAAQANTQTKSIKFINDPFSGMRVYHYLQDLTTPNQFCIFRYVLITSPPSSDSYFMFQDSATTSINFVALSVIDAYDFYVMYYYTSTYQVFLMTAYLDSSSSYSYTI